MANAKKCDRCGRYYEEREANALEELGKILSEISIPRKPQPIFRNDLCTVCEKSLNRWWKETDNEQREAD